MSKFARWVTLTPEERRQVAPPFSGNGTGATSTSFVRQHTCSVCLPDNTACDVTYLRYNAQSHRFEFASPIHQRLYSAIRLAGSVEAIEKKAQELAPHAFREAQREEQQQMRRQTPPPGHRKPDSPPQLRAKSAIAQAGKYAVCLRFKSGSLLPLGPFYEEPEKASEEIRQGKYRPSVLYEGQEMVIGICCRWGRCWKQARFADTLSAEPETKITEREGFPAADENHPPTPSEASSAPPMHPSPAKRKKPDRKPTTKERGNE